MSSVNIDEILSYLSTKFNKIFYDREFVCCVNQDFQVVLKNKNSCCVVVFPLLGPNYLKAVRYQAKIFDLAVFTVGTGQNRAVAVCQKEFLRKNSNEVTATTEVQIMPQNSIEHNSTKLRKKRPERQLYVPPAQRRVPANIEDNLYNNEKCNSLKSDEVTNAKKEIPKGTLLKRHSISKDCEKNSCNSRNKCRLELTSDGESKTELVTNDHKDGKLIESESERQICLDYLFSIDYKFILWHYKITKTYPLLDHSFTKFSNYFKSSMQLPLYNIRSGLKILYILHRHIALWQPKFNVTPSVTLKCDKTSTNDSRTYPLYDFGKAQFLPSECEIQRKTTLVNEYGNNELQHLYKSISRDFDYVEYTAFRISYSKYQRVSDSDVLVDLSVVNCGHNFIINYKNEADYFYECMEDHNVIQCYLDKKTETENKSHNLREQNSLPLDQENAPLIKSSVIVLEKRIDNKKEEKSLSVKKNNDKNTSVNINVTKNDLNNKMTNDILKIPKKSSEHEQEKEIMRKTKEHINRKSRPIMKYVDDTADTLKIGKNNNVNNWEELFDDDGQLQEELFKEVVQKVGTDVTIVKAKEDYSDYVTKQSEDLEHMVELYDFPSTLETHDIIQAFSIINSEAMYVKWVDDTHAILVLGSLKQAQRAIELDNPLIKARPMTAASSISLTTAYKHDLRPAMKRPQTNLQTARRLITTHLGTKSRVSKEQNAKERNDLKAARELKKLAKKNEQDAWEGNIRSAIK